MPKPSRIDQLNSALDAMLGRTDARGPAVSPEVGALMRIASELRTTPNETFKARLKDELERRAAMSTTGVAASKVKAVPEGYRTVTPYLRVKGAVQAIEFYKHAFGATEVMRLAQPDGRIGHAEIKIGDSIVMLSDEFPDYSHDSLSPQSLGGSPVDIHFYVEDVDAWANRAIAAGAKALVPVADQDYGERHGRLEDPFGHHWSISTPLREERMNQVRETFYLATPYLIVDGGVKALEFYERVFGATELLRLANPDGTIAHAEVEIGDSVVMVADEAPEYGRRGPHALGGSPLMVHLYVEDVDAIAKQAVAGGAKVLRPVVDQFYGDRAGRIEDPFGHQWHIATHKEDVSPEEMRKRVEAFMRQQGVATAAKPVQPVPPGFHSVTPYLVAAQAPEVIDFVKAVFGAEERFRAVGSAGGIHAEVKIGDSMVMIGGGGPGLAWKGTSMPVPLHVYVPDVDAVYQRALQAGASSLGEPMDHDYGERGASVKDAAGNHWYIATAKGESYIHEGLHNVNIYLHPRGAAQLIDFMKRAFGAAELGRYADPAGRIMHAAVRIGDSVVEMGEPHGPYQPMPAMIYLYVNDADAVYKTAVAAGGTSLFEPVDQSYGDRNGRVEDPFGNQWYIATHIKDVSH